MNHFEGRLPQPKPVERFFLTEAEAETDVVLHPDHIAHVLGGMKIVSTFYGDEAKSK